MEPPTQRNFTSPISPSPDETVSQEQKPRSQLELDISNSDVKLHLTLPIRHILTFPFLSLHGVVQEALKHGIAKAEATQAARKKEGLASLSPTKEELGGDTTAIARVMQMEMDKTSEQGHWQNTNRTPNFTTKQHGITTSHRGVRFRNYKRPAQLSFDTNPQSSASVYKKPKPRFPSPTPTPNPSQPAPRSHTRSYTQSPRLHQREENARLSLRPRYPPPPSFHQNTPHGPGSDTRPQDHTPPNLFPSTSSSSHRYEPNTPSSDPKPQHHIPVSRHPHPRQSYHESSLRSNTTSRPQALSTSNERDIYRHRASNHDYSYPPERIQRDRWNQTSLHRTPYQDRCPRR